jgi:hypothetical protein
MSLYAPRIALTSASAHEEETRKGTSDEEREIFPRMSSEPQWRGYTEDEVERVRDLISCYDVNTIGSIVACARSFHDNYITGNVIGLMCRDGHFGRDGDRVFLLDAEDE